MKTAVSVKRYSTAACPEASKLPLLFWLNIEETLTLFAGTFNRKLSNSRVN
jgi:hypothetical protein